MSTEQFETEKPESEQLNINDCSQVQFWTKKLGISPEQLKEVVKTIGTSIPDIRRQLGK
ncbi:MAG: DUF3606 domain-containing protein [Chthoniobacterales bacterium]